MDLLNAEYLHNQLFWTGLSFVLLMFFMWKWALPAITDVLDERAGRIKDDLDKASALKTEAQEALAAYEAQVKQAREEAAEIVTRARMEAEQIVQARKTEIESDLSRKSAEAAKSIEQARARALETLHDDVVNIVVSATEKLVEQSVDKKLAGKLTDEAIKGLVH